MSPLIICGLIHSPLDRITKGEESRRYSELGSVNCRDKEVLILPL